MSAESASPRYNELGQPIGEPLPNWTPPPLPLRAPMEGRYCRLEPLDPARHAAALYTASALDQKGRDYTYLPYGPFNSLDEYLGWMKTASEASDPIFFGSAYIFFAILDRASRNPLGIAAYCRIAPPAGSIEVGSIHYSNQLKRSPAATEAMFLMMKNAFELGYRRYEWKCDSLNDASRAAAQRYGFSYEGIFRQAIVYKGRNRDTAWYSVIDSEWPALRTAFETWLDPANFDAHGKQVRRLSDLTAPILSRIG
jgi:RimJ/RimL family protein N-acetyltransferase